MGPEPTKSRGFMFGLFRTLLIAMIAFVAGVLYERHNQSELCDAAGGTWRSGLCGGLQ